MKAQAQFTIHSLNDVIASNTAPSSPYKGQLWVNTSYSPPRTFVYNGSAYKTKTAYSNSTAGVYLGTDGIGLGAGTFYVTSAGALTATSATITGAITATSGSVQNMTVKGRLYFGNNSTYYLDANYNDTSYYIYLPGFRVDDASGAVFSGKLSAASGSFSGTITATGGKIGSLNISDGGLLYGSVSTDNVATGVKINTAGIWAKEGHFSQGSFGYWFLSSSGYFWALYNRALDIYLKSSAPTRKQQFRCKVEKGCRSSFCKI